MRKSSSWALGGLKGVVVCAGCIALPVSAQTVGSARFVVDGAGAITFTSLELAQAFPGAVFTGVRVAVELAKADAGLTLTPGCCRIVDAKKRETEPLLVIDLDSERCAAGTVDSRVTVLGGSSTLLGGTIDSGATPESALGLGEGVRLKQARDMGFRALNLFFREKTGSVTYRATKACRLALVLVFPGRHETAATVRLGDASFPLSSSPRGQK